MKIKERIYNSPLRPLYWAMSQVKGFIKKHIKRNIFDRIENRRIIREWDYGSKEPPPHIIKEYVVKQFARRYRTRYFIETGTYLGEMISAQINTFKKLSSVELSEKLYEDLKQMKWSSKVRLYCGDSGELLHSMITDMGVDSGILFWLDGHYSHGITAKGSLNTPIIKELTTIFRDTRPGCVILIDDARCFIGQDDYPAMDELEAFCRSKTNIKLWEVSGDSIRIAY